MSTPRPHKPRLLHGALAGGLLAGALIVPNAFTSDRPVGLAADAASTRLVADAGFEDAGLSTWTTDGAAGTVTTGTTPAHSGAQALKVSDPGADGVSVRSRAIAVVPGETLTVRAWGQHLDGNAGTLYLEFWRANGTRVDGSVTATDLPAGTGWQAVSVAGIAPPEATTATVLFYSTQSAVGTTVWDDVTLDDVAPPTHRVPNGDFEQLRMENTNQRPTEWTATVPAGNGEKLVSTSAHSGKWSLQTDDTLTDNGVTALSKAVPVKAGETLTVSVQTQVVSGLAGELWLEYRRADGSTEDSYKTSANVTAGSGWRPVTVSKKAPADATSVTIRLYSSYAEKGTTRWDDVVIKSDQDNKYNPALGTGSVLFVGDERVESYTGMTRQTVKGSPKGDPALTDSATGVVLGMGAWDANPQISNVLRDPDGTFKMWYRAAGKTGYATSTDGVKWTRFGTSEVFSKAANGVVENPAFNPAVATSMRYYTIYGESNAYRAAASRDGTSWQILNSGNAVLPGYDVANAAWDPVKNRFFATNKNYPDTSPYGPRDIWIAYSTDFVHWSSPEFVLGTDVLDNEKVKAADPNSAEAMSEIYGMPAIRYGEQYLGIPWMFDIHDSPNTAGNPGADVGRSHLELASSPDLITWSRPVRDSLVTDGGINSWNWGFQVGGTSLTTVGDDVYFYYNSFAGDHGCGGTAADNPATCRKFQGNSKIALVTWKRDRFEAFHAATGGGSVTTRPLAPTGTKVTVNADPGSGQLRVALLDAAGVPVPGYTAGDANPISGDTLGTVASWGTKNTLPTTGGPFRLRFQLGSGDLFSYSIS
jgi:hypothetical protein